MKLSMGDKLVPYQKLAWTHITKIVRFDWSAVFEDFWYQKLAQNKRCVLFSASF